MNLLSSPLPTDDVSENLVSDGTYVYFSSSSAVYRVPVAGGAADVLDTGEGYSSIAAAGGTAAWVTTSIAGNTTKLVVKTPSGQHAVSFPTGTQPDVSISRILVDASGDVVLRVSTTDHEEATWRWTAATGKLAPMPGVGSSGEAVSLYFADRGQIIWDDLAGSGAGTYATTIATGATVQLVTYDNPCTGICNIMGVDAVNLYGAGGIDPSEGSIFTVSGVPRGGGAQFVAFTSSGPIAVTAFNADDTGLYWIAEEPAGIYRAQPTGDNTATLVATVGPASIPTDFAMDECNVYWLDVDANGATSVWGAPK